jgi:integrase
MTAKRDSNGSGTLISTARGFPAQFSIGPGKRKGTLLRACTDEEEAKRRKQAIARLIARLRATGHDAMVPNVIREAGILDDPGMRKLERLVDRIAGGKEPGLARRHRARRDGLTVVELAKLWTSGDLARDYPDHVRAKKTSAGDERLLAWLSKVRMPDGIPFGDRPVATITLDDCDHVMGALPKTAESPATRRQYAQAIRKLLVYAVYPLRLLPGLPIPKGWLPKVSSGKAKAWIYPSEELALMRCPDMPVARRLLFGVLAREGLRVSEALGLTWADLDLERGVLRLDTNKTNDPRSWALGPDVARALDAWRTLRGNRAKKIPRVFPRALVGDRHHLAPRLRRGLERAGVDRPELTKPNKGRMPLRAHDLRGTFVTLALAAGRTEAWVTDRTGHKSSQMIYEYKRAARTAEELGLGWLAPLDEAIPELAPKGRPTANGMQTGGLGGHERSGRESKISGKAHLATGRAPSSGVANPLHVGSNPILTSEQNQVVVRSDPRGIPGAVCSRLG